MTSRERILCAIRGEKTDRVAWAPELNARFIDYHLRAAGKEPATLENPYVEANKLIGSDTLLGVKAYRIEYGGGVEVSQEEIDDQLVRTISTPLGSLVSRSKRHEDASTFFMYEPFVKGKEDYRKYRYYIEHWEVVAQYEEVERTEALLGEDGLISLAAPATPLMHLIMEDMGVEPTLLQIFDYEKDLIELMEVMHEKFKEIYRIVAGSPKGLIVRPFEDSSTTLTSPEMFRRHCLPKLRDYAEILHQGGKLFTPHLCGHLKGLLHFLAEANIDGIEAITPPPTGDVYPREVRKVLPEAVLIGGIDATEFSTLPKNEMLRKIAAVLDSMRGDRRFILGNEEISIRANFETVKAVPELLKRRGNPGGEPCKAG